MSGDADRQTGRTTKQITEAPQSAVYVVANYDQARYAARLAAALGREDIRPVAHYAVRGRVKGLDPLIVDHATLELISPDDAAFLNSWMEGRADVG